MSELRKVFLHTGCNLGERFENLQKANELITSRIGIIVQKSSFYETEAWGVNNQPDYINQALEIKTKLDPLELLNVVFEIETMLGRVRKTKWGARLMDIDVLFYANEVINLPELIIPHPRLHKRNFVLVPMAEIAPEFLHPIFGQTIAQLLKSSTDTCEVRKLEMKGFREAIPSIEAF